MSYSAPFPWFGGKSRCAPLIWERLGSVDNYVEPFAGSLAVLLGAPSVARTETVNDKDGFVANFWRALSRDPEKVAHYADWPANENDLHARHSWLVARREELTARLEGDPEYHDAKIAGWWVWGIGLWIGAGWCSGDGPWSVEDGQLIHLGNAGQGVHRQLIHLGNAGQGVYGWFEDLAARLRHVRVCCGDWLRVLGPTPTEKQGLTGIVLDPPYLASGRDGDLYAVDDGSIANKVREWAIKNGSNPMLRIVLCGYDGEHDMPGGWEVVEWKTMGGYGTQGTGRGRDNQNRERLWFSPHCLGAKQGILFGAKP